MRSNTLLGPDPNILHVRLWSSYSCRHRMKTPSLTRDRPKVGCPLGARNLTGRARATSDHLWFQIGAPEWMDSSTSGFSKATSHQDRNQTQSVYAVTSSQVPQPRMAVFRNAWPQATCLLLLARLSVPAQLLPSRRAQLGHNSILFNDRAPYHRDFMATRTHVRINTVRQVVAEGGTGQFAVYEFSYLPTI